MALIIPEDHKWASLKQITLDMLYTEPFIIREQGSGTLQSIKNSFSGCGTDISRLNIIAQLGSTTAVIQGIKSNIGISIFSTRAIREELAAKTLKALSIRGVNLKRSFYLTRHKDRTASPLCRAFADFLVETSNNY